MVISETIAPNHRFFVSLIGRQKTLSLVSVCFKECFLYGFYPLFVLFVLNYMKKAQTHAHTQTTTTKNNER